MRRLASSRANPTKESARDDVTPIADPRPQLHLDLMEMIMFIANGADVPKLHGERLHAQHFAAGTCGMSKS